MKLFYSSFLFLEVFFSSFFELLCAHGSCFGTLSFTAIDHFHDGRRALLCFISDLFLILFRRSFLSFFFFFTLPFLLCFSFISRFLVLFFLFYSFFGFFWKDFPFGMKKEEKESTPSYLYLHPSENQLLLLSRRCWTLAIIIHGASRCSRR